MWNSCETSEHMYIFKTSLLTNKVKRIDETCLETHINIEFIESLSKFRKLLLSRKCTSFHILLLSNSYLT